MALLHPAARMMPRRAFSIATLCNAAQSPLAGTVTAAAPGSEDRAGDAHAAAAHPGHQGATCSGSRGFAAQTAAEKYELFAPESGLTHIEGYTVSGFIVNDVKLQGGLLCVRDAFYSWDADALDFAAVTLLNPLPEVLVFGGGANIHPLPPQLVRQLGSRGIGLEVSNTVNAIATFNILAQEGRHVAGAFVPVSAQ